MSNSRIERMLMSGRTDNIKQIKEIMEGDSFICECGSVSSLSAGQYIFPGTLAGPNDICCRKCYTKKWNAFREKVKQEIETEAKKLEIKYGN